MHKLLIIILILALPVCLFGQLFPLSDQYLNNTMSFNPAYAGCDEALSSTLYYRNQWTGFTDAPKSLSLALHAPLHNNKVGLGVIVENGSYGIERETSLTASYAYRLELNRGILSFGLGFGVSVLNEAWNTLNAADPGDNQLIDHGLSGVVPVFNLGAYYYTDRWFAGISIPGLLSHEVDKSSGHYVVKNNFGDYNYFLEGGWYLILSDHIKLLPSTLIKYHSGHLPQADLDAQVILYDRLRLGFGYRSNETLVGMIQCQLNKQLRISYAYDFDTGSQARFNSGSHDLVINYLFSYTRKVNGPRQF
jgi:type IX secretion system PorP/SprF family membrane protein